LSKEGGGGRAARKEGGRGVYPFLSSKKKKKERKGGFFFRALGGGERVSFAQGRGEKKGGKEKLPIYLLGQGEKRKGAGKGGEGRMISVWWKRVSLRYPEKDLGFPLLDRGRQRGRRKSTQGKREKGTNTYQVRRKRGASRRGILHLPQKGGGFWLREEGGANRLVEKIISIT